MRRLEMSGSAFLAAAALMWVGGCSSASAAAAPEAKATIESRSGSKVTGKAVFTELPSGAVKVEVWIENATPGTHGLHIHEKGDCSAPDAASAGAHFNAAGNPHAAPSDKAHHNGDFGNILTVKPGPNSVVGKSVIFHEKADDLKTQPSGAAGGRFGCGVVQ